MNILIKNSFYFNPVENQDYTYIYDADTNKPIFISNSLLAELSNKDLQEKQKEILSQIINSKENGTYTNKNIQNGVYLKFEDEFNMVFDCTE